jgi:uncharacterized protein YigE (DUF2233 family)
LETATASGGSVTVHAVRLDLQRWELVLADARETGQPLSDATSFRRGTGGAVAVNAGYFNPLLQPLGLRVSRGVERGRLRKVDHGVFYVAGGKAGLAHARQWPTPSKLEFAIECGPRLVVSGNPLHFKDVSRARRTVIGHDARGRVLLVVADGAPTLAEIADLIAHSEPKGGLGLIEALNLDGGPSTMLELEAGPVRAAVATPVLVPVGIAAVARR